MHKSTLQVLTFKRLDEKKKEKKNADHLHLFLLVVQLFGRLAMELVSEVANAGWAGRVTPPIHHCMTAKGFDQEAKSPGLKALLLASLLP